MATNIISNTRFSPDLVPWVLKLKTDKIDELVQEVPPTHSVSGQDRFSPRELTPPQGAGAFRFLLPMERSGSQQQGDADG